MTDTHICNLCPLRERRHGIWANRRLEDQACPVYVQSKKTFGDNISAKNEAMQQDMVMTLIWQQRLMIAKLADAS